MSAKKETSVRHISENRRAKFDYTVEESLEAGLQLLGSEVKALRQGTANLGDAYAMPHGQEMFLHHVHIGVYKPSGVFAHEPMRKKKLLMHREEIDRWAAKVKERGYSIIPLELYFKDDKAKVKLGLCRGKTHEDRRHSIKERESKREMERALRRR